MERKTAADGVITLFKYNGKGELIESVIDMNPNGEIDYGGTDTSRKTAHQFSLVKWKRKHERNHRPFF
jgi:hypothetical protein